MRDFANRLPANKRKSFTDDIRRQARTIVDNAGPFAFRLDLVEQAIDAERKRCAAIADRIVAENNTGSGFDSQTAYSTAWRIAEAIRKGGE